MENFAILQVDRETAIPPETEETTTFDLQRFGDNAFGLPEPDESEGASETPETPQTPGTTATETPEEPAQTPAQGQSATVQTGQSTSADDPLAAYRKPDGQVDLERLAKDFAYHKTEAGRVRNELGAERKARQELEARLNQSKPEPAQIDWEAINEQFMQELSTNPAGAILQLINAYGSQAIAPIQSRLAQIEAATAVQEESAKWWDEHSDLPDDVRAAMDREYDQWKDLLETTDPRNPYHPLISPSKALDLLLKVAQGQAAPQAIQQAAQAAAQAAAQGQTEKAGAGVGTAANKAPTSTTGDPILDGLKKAAKEGANIFGV